MQITKIGHCCLLIRENNLTILTDPGAWSTKQDEISGIDLVLITHEHADHLHIESLRAVLKNNPQAQIITNSSVGKILDEQKLSYSVVENGEFRKFHDLLIEGFGTEHAPIYESINPVMNTGYLIGERLFYPGDALTNPKKPVELLALPIAGPWLTMAQLLDYAKEVKPTVAFPIHDGMLDPVEWIYRYPSQILPEAGIKFDILGAGETLSYPEKIKQKSH